MEIQEYQFIDLTNELFFHCAQILIRMIDRGPIAITNYLNENNLNDDIYNFLQKGLLLIYMSNDSGNVGLALAYIPIDEIGADQNL